MTKVLNSPETFKDDYLRGFLALHAGRAQRVPDASGVMRAEAAPDGRVAIVAGGGTGHFPLWTGLVTDGLIDAAVVGEVFTSPSAEQVYRCTRAVAGDAGVLHLICNYSGDVMNFQIAADRCAGEGIAVETAIIADDVASGTAESGDRRGIAGGAFVYRLAAAGARRGDPLAEVAAVARRANDATRTFGVAFSGCTLPGADGPLFEVGAGEMELGLGIHGEPGVETGPLAPAGELARRLVDTLLDDASPPDGAAVAVLLNGLGATSGEELFVLYGEIHDRLGDRGVSIHDAAVGEHVTSLDMAGCSLSLLILDDELTALYDEGRA
jgi:D-erythrulose 4-kinase